MSIDGRMHKIEMLFCWLVWFNDPIKSVQYQLTKRSKMNSVELLAELSKFSADMKLADSKVYFDNIIVEKSRIIFDNRGDQQYITVGEAVEILRQQAASKSVWIISDFCEIPASYIKQADYEGEPYIQFHIEY